MVLAARLVLSFVIGHWSVSIHPLFSLLNRRARARSCIALASLIRPECSPRCEASKGDFFTRSYGTVFWNKFHSWPSELIENMKLAASILKQFGHPQRLDTEGDRDLHVAFDYYCDYTEEEAVKIGKIPQ